MQAFSLCLRVAIGINSWSSRFAAMLAREKWARTPLLHFQPHSPLARTPFSLYPSLFRIWIEDATSSIDRKARARPPKYACIVSREENIPCLKHWAIVLGSFPNQEVGLVIITFYTKVQLNYLAYTLWQGVHLQLPVKQKCGRSVFQLTGGSGPSA